MPTHQSCPIRLVRHSLGYSHGLVEIHIITFNWNMTAGPCQAIGSALKYAALARAPGFDPVTCLSQWRRPPTFLLQLLVWTSVDCPMETLHVVYNTIETYVQ